MDLNAFLPIDTKPTNSLISGEIDPEKYQKIATKLSEKRKMLEVKIKNLDLTAEEKEEAALDLYQSKQDMATFGISEIDYQAYLAQEPESGSDQQLPLI